MVKKLLSYILVFALVLSICPSVFAETGGAGRDSVLYVTDCHDCGAMFVGTHSKCSKCGSSNVSTMKRLGGGVAGGGAGRATSSKKYYTGTSSSSSGSTSTSYTYVANSGNTSNYSILNTTNKTFNYSYDNRSYTYNYNNYTYNNYYDYYTINIDNSRTYYVTNNYTYYTIYYPTGEVYETDGNSVDEYGSVDIYYELPDGRNSYNLTTDDIWGQYFNYTVSGAERVAEDDGVTLGLWHLDGDYTNSAYNQTITPSFDSTDFRTIDDNWGLGLYVPGTFLPTFKSTDSKNFTIEFRVYNGSKSYIRLPFYKGYTYKTKGTYHTTCSWTDKNYVTTQVGAYDSEYYFDSDCTQTYLYKTVQADPIYLSGSGWVSVSLVCNDGDFKVFINGQEQSLTYTESAPYTLYYKRIKCYNATDSTSDEDHSTYFVVDYVTSGTSNMTTTPSNPSNLFNNTFSGVDYSPKIYIKGVLDELRYSSSALYTTNYNPSLQPFDTNLVQVRPSSPSENDIVVYTDGVEVSDYRIGGVRPTYPTSGYVWLNITDEYKCDSVQIYNGSAWVAVTAEIYSGGEWSDVAKFDFENCCFVKETVDTGGDSGGDSGDSGSGGDSGDSGSGTDTSDSSLWDKLFGGLAGAVSAIFKGLLSVLATFVEGFASVVSTLTDLFTSLVGLGGQFGDFLGVFFGWLPSEITALLSLSITLGIVMAVIRFFWK